MNCPDCGEALLVEDEGPPLIYRCVTCRLPWHFSDSGPTGGSAGVTGRVSGLMRLMKLVDKWKRS